MSKNAFLLTCHLQDGHSRFVSDTGMRGFRRVNVIHECFRAADIFDGRMSFLDGGVPYAPPNPHVASKKYSKCTTTKS